MLRFLLPAGLFGLLVLFFLRGLTLDPSRIPSPLIGKPAPVFSLPSLANPDEMVGNENMRGAMALLNVWATWCVGCRAEHEALLAIAASSDVPIFGLNWKDDSNAARRWLTQLGNPYAATAVDAEGRVAIDWGIYGAPETFLIDADGIVRHKHIGPITMQAWEQDFLPLIRAAGAGS